MDLYLDVDSRSFVTSLTSSIPLEGLTFKRRDTAQLNLWFVQNGTNLDLGAIDSGGSGATLSSLSVGLKNDGDYASAFLAFADTSLFYEDVVNYYTFSLSLNTSELDSLFTADSEISSISAMLEFQWTQCDGSVFSSTTLPVLVQNDVIRGDEPALALANPSYPDAASVFTYGAFDTASAFPSTGVLNKLYQAQDTNFIYSWNGSAYERIQATILTGIGVPLSSLGATGDLYLATDTSVLYQKGASSWTGLSLLKGATGAIGPANTLSIGTVSTGTAGTSASATITGTSPTQTLNLTIPAGAAGSGTYTKQSANFTAAVGVIYVTTGSITVSDPASPASGDSYTVYVGGGTATIGGTAYAVSKLPVVRYYSGSAWSTLASVSTDNLTLNGTNNTAPSQTASSSSSLLTRSLSESVMPWSKPFDLKAMTLANSANASTGSIPDAQSDYSLTLTTGSAVSGNYARASIGGLATSFGGGQGTQLTNAWSLCFELGMQSTPTTFQFGMIVGTAAAATSLVPSTRALSFRVTGSGTGVIGIHNGTTETTSTLSNCGISGAFDRYILVWSGTLSSTPNVLSLYSKTFTFGQSWNSVNACGSVTLAPGANYLPGSFLTVMLEATGAVSQGYNPTAVFTVPKFYPWAVIQ